MDAHTTDTVITARQTVRTTFNPSQLDVAVKPPYSHQPQLQDGLLGAASATTYLPDFTLATPLFAQTSFDLEDLSAYTLPVDIADWTLPVSSAPDYWEPFSVASLENSIFENVNPPLRSTGAPEGNPSINTSPVDYNSILNSANANPSPPSERMTPLPPKSNTPSPRSSTSTHKPSTEPPSRIEKRTKNTLAARRYRQKRVDQMTELEEALKETQAERDALKVRVARLEGEAEALRQLLRDRT